jgi:hypothetical protein
MRIGERVTPILAAVSAVATLACCLPVAATTLFGVGGILAVVGQYQAWLLPISGLLLGVGGVQMWRSRRVCQRTSAASLIILLVSAAIVSLVAFFPQTVAGLLTDWMS